MHALQKAFLKICRGPSAVPPLASKGNRECVAPNKVRTDQSTYRDQIRSELIGEEVKWLSDLSVEDPSLDYGTIHALLVRLYERTL